MVVYAPFTKIRAFLHFERGVAARSKGAFPGDTSGSGLVLSSSQTRGVISTRGKAVRISTLSFGLEEY